MSIYKLEDNLESINDERLKAIAILLIEAVRDFPKYNLQNIEDYLLEIKKILPGDDINLNAIDEYQNNGLNNEDKVWVDSSLNSLREAMELSEIYKMNFDDVLNEVIRLS